MKRRGGFPKGPPRPIRVSMALSVEEYLLLQEAWLYTGERPTQWMRARCVAAAIRAMARDHNIETASTTPLTTGNVPSDDREADPSGS